MDIDKIDLNIFINRYVDFVDKISNKYHYESNIKHLLYLIVPAFIIKYDLKNESQVLKCFEEIPITVTGSENKNITASFSRLLVKTKDGYETRKFILLNEYKTADLINMLDNIIHEYNHAINSINYEISYDDEYVKVRTGLSYILYDKKSLKPLKKSNEVALEEIINTAQTSDIINIINSFNKKKIDNIEFTNVLYSLKNDIGKDIFVSEAYGYDSIITKELIKNKTFTPTISNLRYKGLIQDIPYLFDNVIGKDGEYKRLNKLLTEIHELEYKYAAATIFKNRFLNEIRTKSKMVLNIINDYDNKCIFKS